MMIRGRCRLNVNIGSRKEDCDFHIIEEIGYDVIFGTEFLHQASIKLDFRNER